MRSYASDRRTPLAWRHRDMTLHHHSGHHHHHHSHSHHSSHGHRHRSSPSSVTTSSTSSSSDEREEVPMVRAHHHPGLRRPNSRQQHHHSQFSATEHHLQQPPPPFRSGGTLRSTRSVPALALATWDGEPCPVHGHGLPPPPLFPTAGTMRRHGSLFDVRPPPPTTLFGPPLLDKKSFHGSMQLVGGGNPWLAPPLMRPRPFVIPAGAEPLPVRDPYGRRPPTLGYAPSKMADDPDYDQVCCKGHLIVLWIILAVVTIGVILGIVLGVTIA